MLNHIVLHGRLSRDVELRRTQSGVAVASTAVAVDRDYTDKDGRREVDFIELVAWRQTGEHLARFFSKGKEILVSGRLETRKLQDKEGKTRVQVEVNVDRIDFCGPKDAGGRIATEPAAPRNDSYAEPAAAGDYAPIDDDDSELPF
jgi:single-strand DNA-binding protein